jgi:two-component system, LytTR family, sensor kinase
LEFLDLYIGIQKRRFGERLGFEIQADQSTLEMRLPPLILQPLVENAIRHGIGKHKGDDRIGIFASEHDGGLQVEIWNSNSVVDDVTERLLRRGVGLRNTKARLECIYGPAASLLFRPLARGGGAVAVIFVPGRLTPNPEQHSTAGVAV